LPAVVNVKVGTQVIKTGQKITVDGAKGLVSLEG
jgi:phosphohistidine swiveling domain-containing protein